MTGAGGLDVLIVDDHEGMRVLLREVLERAGVAEVRTAANGAEALALLAERDADVLLADQTMPGMDGCALIAAAHAAGSRARAIVISGRGEAGFADAARAAGAAAVLAKPISPRDLLQTIERVLGR